jgi:transposase InsO family protein
MRLAKGQETVKGLLFHGEPDVNVMLVGGDQHSAGRLFHRLVFNAEHLRRILTKYVAYYNEVRTHVSLGKDAPCTRPIERFARGAANCTR